MALEQEDILVAFFLNLSKAFDCAEHKLLEILDSCGFRDNQLKLIQSYQRPESRRLL